MTFNQLEFLSYLNYWLTTISFFSITLVLGLLLYSNVLASNKYYKQHVCFDKRLAFLRNASNSHSSIGINITIQSYLLWIELLFSILPYTILFLMISPGLYLLYEFELITNNTLIVNIFGQSWFWSYNTTGFVFANLNVTQSFLKTSDYLNFSSYFLLANQYLFLPCFENLKLLVTSLDVIHSWGIYSFGCKIDAVPSRLNLLYSLRLLSKGEHRGFCYELCGIGHTSMQTICVTLIVLTSISPLH